MVLQRLALGARAPLDLRHLAVKNDNRFDVVEQEFADTVVDGYYVGVC